MAETEAKQARPFWLLLGLSVIIIIFGIITICSPSLYWRFMDIILGFFLILSGISTIIGTIKNKNAQFIWILICFGILMTILGFLLVFSRSHFVGTIIIWIFALWAFIRGIMLIVFSLSNKNNLQWRWAILGLGILLFILGIVIMFSRTDEARRIAGICIGISTIFDGISLLMFALNIKNNPNIQTEIITQSNQNEIAQGDVVITETTVVAQVNTQPAAPEIQQPTPDTQQPTPEIQQPTPEVQQPTPEVQQPTPDTQQPTPEVQQPGNENPA